MAKKLEVEMLKGLPRSVDLFKKYVNRFGAMSLYVENGYIMYHNGCPSVPSGLVYGRGSEFSRLKLQVRHKDYPGSECAFDGATLDPWEASVTPACTFNPNCGHHPFVQFNREIVKAANIYLQGRVVHLKVTYGKPVWEHDLTPGTHFLSGIVVANEPIRGLRLPHQTQELSWRSFVPLGPESEAIAVAEEIEKAICKCKKEIASIDWDSRGHRTLRTAVTEKRVGEIKKKTFITVRDLRMMLLQRIEEAG